jgi:hypothetical protein
MFSKTYDNKKNRIDHNFLVTKLLYNKKSVNNGLRKRLRF